MKRFLSFLTIFALLSWAISTFAGPLYPVADGYDVLVPHIVIEAIPGYDANKPVYAATDINGWFVRSGWATNERKNQTKMTREGDCWRAKGMKGARFHPVQLSEIGEPSWARLENVFPLDSPFIDNSGTGPCLKVN